MALTKAQTAQVAACPFNGKQERVVEFFGTKKLANQFLTRFAEAYAEGVRAEDHGDSFDTNFENCFQWQTNSFWDENDFFSLDDMDVDDCGHTRKFRRNDDLGLIASLLVSSDDYDVDLYLSHVNGRRCMIMDYCNKEAAYCLSAYWLD